MVHRHLGRTALQVSPIGFGAFKIGRNEAIKYERGYALPSDEDVSRLLNGVLDLGVNLIDTAPAYGTSEERIGAAIGHRSREFIISTKVGETFQDGRSTYDFSSQAVCDSVTRSLRQLRRETLDLVFVHSDGRDIDIIDHTDVVPTLQALRDSGSIRAIGFSGKTVAGAMRALHWADAIMVEYHLNDRSHEPVLIEAAQRGVGVIVKKGLASGKLAPAEAISFVLRHREVGSMVIGGLDLDHFRSNVAAANEAEENGD